MLYSGLDKIIQNQLRLLRKATMYQANLIITHFINTDYLIFYLNSRADITLL